MQTSDLENRFAFHPATTEEKQNDHASVRANCLYLANFLNEKLPEGREKSLAITHLEEVMLWGNAALARGTTNP
jgi:hypothetical protein